MSSSSDADPNVCRRRAGRSRTVPGAPTIREGRTFANVEHGDDSISYPYYPSRKHACKPAQGKADFIDCVNLGGWTCDFLCARRFGFEGGFNSRLGVGPTESYRNLGVEMGMAEVMAVTANRSELSGGINIVTGKHTCRPVSEAHGLAYTDPAELLEDRESPNNQRSRRWEPRASHASR